MALRTLVRVANRLNRTLVIPPLRCQRAKAKRWAYCNLCSFGGYNCLDDITGTLIHPVKESVFFTNEHVPSEIRREDRLNTVYGFLPSCVEKTGYRSDFPAHRDHSHDIKCLPCAGKVEDCAVEFGLTRREKVLKFFSLC